MAPEPYNSIILTKKSLKEVGTRQGDSQRDKNKTKLKYYYLYLLSKIWLSINLVISKPQNQNQANFIAEKNVYENLSAVLRENQKLDKDMEICVTCRSHWN